jgi:deoxyribodipyrimidine photolyase
MELYITDKTGMRFWNTNVAAGFAQGERNNLERHLCRIKAGEAGYGFVDAASARLMEECEEIEMSDYELLDELGAL